MGIHQNEKGQWISKADDPVVGPPVCTNVRASTLAFLKTLPNRAAWIREAIEEKLQREQESKNNSD